MLLSACVRASSQSPFLVLAHSGLFHGGEESALPFYSAAVDFLYQAEISTLPEISGFFNNSVGPCNVFIEAVL